MLSKIKSLLLLGSIAILAVAGLYIGENANAGAPAGGPPPGPMPVNVIVAKESSAQVWSEYSGRLDAVDTVELRPQVSGTIKEINFQDGQNVKAGDVLYIIDQEPYKAAAAQAQADVAVAQSQYTFAQKELERAQDLSKNGAISKTILDERQNSASVAKSNIAAANARLRQAKINLDYASVEAPISGRIGRAEITKGNLVQAGPNAPVLTTIVANDEVYADFEVDEKTYLQQVRSAGANGLASEQEIPVKLTVRGDEDKVYNGTIHSFDNRIDTATGTIRARALFKNEDGALLPGMFATIKMGGAGNDRKILIPERAIGTDQDRKFVYVVSPEHKVVYREIKAGSSVGTDRVVEGVKPGEQVIVEGLMRIRPDMPVAPQVQATEPAAGDMTATPDAEAPSEDETPAEEATGQDKPKSLLQ